MCWSVPVRVGLGFDSFLPTNVRKMEKEKADECPPDLRGYALLHHDVPEDYTYTMSAQLYVYQLRVGGSDQSFSSAYSSRISGRIR